MSLVRAFTTKRNRHEELQISPPIGRAASQRAGKPVYRSQISAPVALVSTTNPLSYDAPNIIGTTPIRNVSGTTETSTRTSEGDDSDASTCSIDSLTDASSVEDSPITSPEPEKNHLSCYFKPAVNTATSTRSPSSSARPSLDAPSIPQRVPSHSKKAHEFVHRKRSVQRLKSPPVSVVRHSHEMFTPLQESVEAPQEQHPFSNELAQLDEAVEDLSHAVRDEEADAELAYMKKHGLAKFDVAAYLVEIHGLFDAAEAQPTEQPAWI